MRGRLSLRGVALGVALVLLVAAGLAGGGCRLGGLGLLVHSGGGAVHEGPGGAGGSCTAGGAGVALTFTRVQPESPRVTERYLVLDWGVEKLARVYQVEPVGYVPLRALEEAEWRLYSGWGVVAERVRFAERLSMFCGGGGYGVSRYGGYIVFWKTVEFKPNVAVYSFPVDGGRVVLAPPGLDGVVEADYALVTRGCVVLAFEASRLARLLGGGVHTILFHDGSGLHVLCRLEVGSDVLRLWGCENASVKLPSKSFVLGDYATIIDALLDGMQWAGRVAGRLVGGRAGSPGEALWRLHLWLANTSYDAAKASTQGHGVWSPLRVAEAGRGVCGDYATAEALALYAALPTVEPAVVVFPSLRHAAAGLASPATIVLLDQKLPPIELADYMEYIDTLDNSVAVYILTRSPEGLVAFKLSRSEVNDTYPGDRLPRSVLEAATLLAAGATGVNPLPAMDSIAAMFASNFTRVFNGAVIPVVLPLVGPQAVPVSRLYTPLAASYYARYIALLAAQLLPEEFRGSIALAAVPGEDVLVYILAVPVKASIYTAATPSGPAIIVDARGTVRAQAYVEGGAVELDARKTPLGSVIPVRGQATLVYVDDYLVYVAAPCGSEGVAR